jgi:hypothetical protein
MSFTPSTNLRYASVKARDLQPGQTISGGRTKAAQQRRQNHWLNQERMLSTMHRKQTSPGDFAVPAMGA